MWTYIWLAVILLAVLFEALTAELVSVWFIPAALVAMLLSIFENIPPYVQVIVFLVLGIIGVFLLRRIFKNKFYGSPQKTNIEAIIGSKCVVTEKVDNLAGCGQAKYNGQYWAARSVSDDVTLNEGDIVTVVAIEGVKLICRK